MDSGTVKKYKISLEDYAVKQDLENRLLMAKFTPVDVAILEEILYSPLKIPLKKLCKNTDLSEDELLPILMKLCQTGLFAFEEDTLIVDKEMRKYFEGEIVRFDPEFKPGMEFVQGLLRKVPIHILPIWYSLPRLSNHIFESIVEKYLLTPHIFQRYLADLTFPDPLLSSLIKEVYSSPHLKVYGDDLIKKYHLSQEQFEEHLILLEFHLVCFLGYEKQGEEYKRIVTPFQEWSDYISFLKSTEVSALSPLDSIERKRPSDFSYVQDLAFLLSRAKQQPLPISKETLHQLTHQLKSSPKLSPPTDYVEQLIQKLCQLKLAHMSNGRLTLLDSAQDFLDMTSEEQALFLYRHPLNRLSFPVLSSDAALDRSIRETEKSIVRVLSKGWVYFEDFLKGVIVPLSDATTIALKRQGKTWKYQLPSYSDEELAFIKVVVLEWLFEVGITAVGRVNGRECFCVTAFGQSLFGQ